MRSRAWVSAVCCLGLLLATTPGWSQGGGGDARAEAAQSMFRLAVSEFKAGNYQVALDKLLEVYELDPNPIILYNIARAYEEMGMLAEAADYFQRAVADPKLPENLQAEVGRRLPKVLPALKRREAHTIAVNSVSISLGQAADRALDEYVKSGQGGDTFIINNNTTTATDSGLLWGGGSAALIGAGLLTGALLVDLGLSDPIDELKDPATRADRVRTLDLQDQISNGQTTATILYITGGVALAAGAAMLTLALMPGEQDPAVEGGEGQPPAEEGAFWAPLLSPEAAGVWFGGRFQ